MRLQRSHRVVRLRRADPYRLLWSSDARGTPLLASAPCGISVNSPREQRVKLPDSRSR